MAVPPPPAARAPPPSQASAAFVAAAPERAEIAVSDCANVEAASTSSGSAMFGSMWSVTIRRLPTPRRRAVET
ncbi:hypothetical protein BFL35_14660 [Clavibacter michiganensis]|nr:hypothetical protein BFL35_14660 [Clavibacter michiganensis]